MSGACGRTDGRDSGAGAAAGALAAAAGGAAGMLGGPIEMAGIAGRDRAAAAAADEAAGADGCAPPISMERVTTTAGCGEDAGAAAGWGADATDGAADGAGCAAGAAFAPCAPCDGAAAGCPFDEVPCAPAARFTDFVEAGAFGVAAVGCCGAPALRPSFGGRCIDGPSSAVLGDAASVSPFGLPEKSLEKTLIAEHPP